MSRYETNQQAASRVRPAHLSVHFSCIFALSLCVFASARPIQAQEEAVGVSDAPAATTAFTHIPSYDPDLANLETDQQSSSDSQSTAHPTPMPENGTVVKHGQQTRRILGIIPNFRSVSADEKLPPQTPHQKFITTTQDSFDYSSAVIPLLLSGVNMARDATPEFGQGMEGFGKYFWHSALDQTTENYFVEFVYPVLTHEDSRYYTMGHGGFMRRTVYAATRAVITRSDSGRNTINISEIMGSGSSAALSTAYYPEHERNFSSVTESWGLDIGIDAFTFFLKEFWPDINHSVFHYNSGQ